MSVDFLIGYGEPVTGHQPSRALLLSALEKLRQTENLSRTWEELHPVTVDLAGLPAMLLDTLRSNTTAVVTRLEQQAQWVDAWHTVLTDVANSDLEEAQTWRDALLTAAIDETGAADPQARVEALLHGDAPLLRAIDLSRQAAEDAQTAFVLTYTAAKATGFRLSCLSAYLAAATKDDGVDEPPSPDQATVAWVTSFAQDAEEFTANSKLANERHVDALVNMLTCLTRCNPHD